MGLKKYAPVLVLLLLLWGSGLYLAYRYSTGTVEFYYTGHFDTQGLESLKKDTGNIPVILHYSMWHNGNMLVMTTGRDNSVRQINLSKGGFICDIKRSEAVIGDKAADSYFRSDDVIGQSVEVLGKRFRVVGIEHRSRSVYISYDDKLEDQAWQKKSILFNIGNKGRSDLELENLANKLAAYGISIYDTIVYKEVVYTYYNAALLILLVCLLYFTLRLYRILRKTIMDMIEGYKMVRRTVRLQDFLYSNPKRIWRILLLLAAFAAAVFTGLWLKSCLWIPPAWIPDNLFSLDSYARLIKQSCEKLWFRLDSGWSGIAAESAVIRQGLLLVVTAYFIIKPMGVRKGS